MIDLEPPIRRAKAADGRALADLINIAGEGLPEHFWRQMAAEGEDPWELGARRQGQKAEEGKVFVADEGAGVLAALTGYPIPDLPDPVPAGEDPLIVPLLELENEAPGTFYVNVLAAYPEARGRGLGTRLMQLAEKIARENGISAMSIIVADGNSGARRLYERLGYREAARRAIAKSTWTCDSDDWVLLVKRL